jgi:hypothetical protein
MKKLLTVSLLSLVFFGCGASQNVETALKCTQLYELKKVKYWHDEIGQSSPIYNKNLNTCLALNIYNDFETKDYFAMIIDMSNDETLLYYSAKPQGFYVEGDQIINCEYEYDYLEYLKNGKETKEYGCEKWELFDKMFEEVRNFGFKIFDGFENK